MTCTVLLEIKVKKENIDAMMPGFREQLPDTRAFDGCIAIAVNQNKDDLSNFVIVETWETREKYEAYFAWRTERGDIAGLEESIEGEVSLRYFDLQGV